MLFVRFFSDEMRCGDTVTYFASDEVERNNATVVSMQFRLTLHVTDNSLLDELGAETLLHSISISDESQVASNARHTKSKKQK